ncbi:MAG: endopeptidase La [Clostridia bacterium]|nr:endopeptidase La [Clostridia bacterium]
MEEKMIRTNILPVVPLRGRVAFPNCTITFEVGRNVTVNALERAALGGEKLIFICAQKDIEKVDVTENDLYTVGTVATVRQTVKGSNVYRVSCQGLYRGKARTIKKDESGGYFYAVVDEYPPVYNDYVLEEAYLRTAKALVKDVVIEEGKIAKETLEKLDRCENADEFVNQAINAMRVRLDVKQEILSTAEVVKRLQLLDRCLNDELQIARVERKIAGTVKKNIDKSQKEYFLREQLRAIHTELGDDGKEEDEYREKVKNKNLPKEMEEKCLKEIDRLSKMQSSSPEYTVITGYLDQVLELPWTEQTTDTEQLSDCVSVLEADHYGLEKIKERIVEYLAVLKLTGNMNAPILCLVGPPGVGKTSIAQSVARSLGRNFVRMSLGGVKDEAEIRGHRRTYIGSMPGRILYAMKNAKSVNPVFLLDEIDKISSDMRGDPASALLEVLDPEQNSTFRDRYLELPYDLSKVLFIATANTLETIPAPLRDRMEIIQLSGYTIEEKSEIAKRYLLPKQIKANGLEERSVKLKPDALKFIIEGYTMEAGVRTLERQIGAICRKIAVKKANNSYMGTSFVKKKEVEELLGTPKFKGDEKRKKEEIGAVTGLAWTAFGGTTLTVEVVATRGKGEVVLTGKLGDVMKESALTAMTYIKANAEKYDVEPSVFEYTNVHVHVPEGATPKDGPSAGITIATAILSVFTGRKARKDIAMTGEVTLRGKVLPIGGLKEKALAARRMGVKNVIIPIGNVSDIENIPETVRKDLTFYPVENVEEVFELVLLPAEKKREFFPAQKRTNVTAGELSQNGMRCKS